MAENRKLQGVAPLTTVKGVSGSFLPPVYRGTYVDPATVDPDDRERLVDEGFLQWVVADGEGWKPADGGESVTATNLTLGDDDGGDVVALTEPTDVSDPNHPDRVAARSKLPADGSAPDGRASQAVWVEYGVAQGRDYTALAALGKDDLMKELKK